MNEVREKQLETLAQLVVEVYGSHGGIENRGIAISKVVQDRYGGHGIIDLTEEQIVSLAKQIEGRLSIALEKVSVALKDYDYLFKKEAGIE